MFIHKTHVSCLQLLYRYYIDMCMHLWKYVYIYIQLNRFIHVFLICVYLQFQSNYNNFTGFTNVSDNPDWSRYSKYVWYISRYVFCLISATTSARILPDVTISTSQWTLTMATTAMRPNQIMCPGDTLSWENWENRTAKVQTLRFQVAAVMARNTS